MELTITDATFAKELTRGLARMEAASHAFRVDTADSRK